MKADIPKLTQAAIADNRVRKKDYLIQLNSVSSQKTAGYFGRDSASWALYREPWVLIGGIRALLLQIAHPAIADGVHRYSNFQEDALERGKRTFQAMAKIYFAEEEIAKTTAVQLHHIHGYIRGTYTPKDGQPKDYCANDPDLLLWVLATLIDTTFLVFEEFYDGMPSSQKEQFYEESKVTALLMGIPESVFPPTLSDFNHYFEKMIHEELQVDPTSMQLSEAILNNRYFSKSISSMLASGLLPPSLSEAFGLQNTQQIQFKYNRLVRRIRFLYRLIPPYLRYAPAWHQAHFRVAWSQGRRTKLLGRFYTWLSKKMSIPLGI